MRRLSVCAVIPLLAILLLPFKLFAQDSSQKDGATRFMLMGDVAGDTVISARYRSIRAVPAADADTVVSAGFWKIVVPKAEAQDLVDMGQVDLGMQRDSIVTAYLRSTGGAPVRIDSITIDPPFSLLEPVALPFVIPAGGTRSVTFRFQPAARGIVTGTIAIGSQTEHLRKTIRGEGMSPQGSATIVTDTIRARAGELVSVPLRLRNVQSVRLNTVIQTELRFNATLLSPAGSTPAGTVKDGERRIAVSSPWAVSGDEGVLTTLQFTAMLGNAEGTPIRLENSRAASGQVVLAEIPGSFILTDICREGGPRLFTATGKLGLFQNRPNPFNATTVIEYEVIEAGATRLVVMDMLGRSITTLADGTFIPGRYLVTFDSATLPSGSYMALLLTPSKRKAILMNVMK